MTKPPVLKPREVVALLSRFGFTEVRQRGSHRQFRHPDGRRTTVPFHQGRDISPTLLRQIAKDIGVSVAEFTGRNRRARAGPAALVPAAGRSERFGAPKLLADLRGVPLVVRTLRSLLDAGIGRIVLIVAPGSPLLEPGVLPAGMSAVTTVVNPDPSRGMFSSIQAGCAAAAGGPLLVLPADMPFVRPATVAAVATAASKGDAVILPTFNGKHGHPIGLPESARAAILTANPESNLKAVLAATGLPHVDLNVDDPGVLRDVDVPSDLSNR